MPDVIRSWSSLGVPSGDVLSSGNINAPGNGDPITWQTPTGTPTLIARRPGGVAGEAGFGLSSDVATEIMRLDLRYADLTAGDAYGQAVRWIFTPPAPPSGADTALAIGRSSSAFSGYLYWTTTGTLKIRNAAIATVTSSLTGSPTFSAATSETPALVTGHSYLIDLALIRSVSSPSTSNGRIMARVRSLTAPGVWNGGAEWFFDTGYTVNVHTDLQQYWRFGKPLGVGTFAEAMFAGIRWRNITAPETSLTKTASIANFLQATGPLVNTGDTGSGYLIQAIGSPSGGGTLSYGIVQTAGVTTSPILIGEGAWLIDQGSAALEYDVTVTETGGTATVQHYVVPPTPPTVPVSHIKVPKAGGGWEDL